MEKVKLTKEQVTALEKAINDYGIDTTMNDHSPHNWGGCLSPLNELKTHQMARALYIGYEVEETYKVGDLVVHIPTGIIGEISHVNGNWINFFHSDEQKAVNISVNDLRHATPEEIAEEKQRRWWAKHGRDVYEFKSGDLIDHEHYVVEVMEVRSDMLRVEINAAVGTITKEYYDLIKVICFAEDRKDMEGENE